MATIRSKPKVKGVAGFFNTPPKSKLLKDYRALKRYKVLFYTSLLVNLFLFSVIFKEELKIFWGS